MDEKAAVERYLRRSGRIPGAGEVRFLAAGEYNQNWLVETPQGPLVVRVNRGSQLGLADQIGYEFGVLRAVEPSGVTPTPYWVDPRPEGLPGGALCMEFLPGRPLDYRTDLVGAARVFARVHAVRTDSAAARGLMVQAAPVADIAAESLQLLTRQPDHPRMELRGRLLDYHAEVLRLAGETRELFAAEKLVICNTEVNSGNFLVHGDAVRLVDWEKAVLTPRYQDLGHFLVPTTTLWKTNVRLSREEKRGFLAAYREESARFGVELPGLDEFEWKTRILERTILLRALSWCFMAWHEYTQQERAIRNEDTFAKIESYLDEAEAFLAG